MARANLNIQQAIQDCFYAAQESKSVRIINIKIRGEELVLENSLEKQSGAHDDFNYVLPSTLSETEACFSLFNISTNCLEAQQWILVAWVPDGCRVRDKMLYSSSREDLKRSLGLGYFKTEYVANQFSDLTWEQYLQSQRNEFDLSVLTETERLIMEEKTISASEVTATKASALGVIPFAMRSEVLEKFEDFKQEECNWIEMAIESEAISLVGAKLIDTECSMMEHVNVDNASFIAAKLKKYDGILINVFIFSCPESVPIRTKMTMSSSKASVLAAAAQQGISFDKLYEIRDVEEIDSVVKQDLLDKSNVSTSSSAAAAQAHSKPQRPGKGKARVTKFKADE